MKTLILVRHAKSSWSDSSLMDIQRPLNKRGSRNAPEMGKRLKNRGILPDIIVSSPAVRAFTTAELISKEIGYSSNQIRISHELFHSSSSGILETIRSLENEYNCAMLFGHNPGFTYFANELCNIDIWNIPTAGLVECTLNIDKWGDTSKGIGELSYFDFPKNDSGESAL